MSISSYAARIEYQTALVYDVRCTVNGDPWYMIVKVDPAKHDRFLQALENGGSVNFSLYGAIIGCGRMEPSPDVKADLRQRFGMYRDEQD